MKIQKMKILSIIHYPVFGGPHNRNAKLIPVLKDEGIETIVLLPNEKGNAFDRLNTLGIKCITISLSRLRATKNIFKHAAYTFRFLQDVYNIYKVIRKNSIDIVQINGFVNIQGVFAAKLAGKPVILQILDTYTPMYAIKLLMPLIKPTVSVLMSTGERVASQHPGSNHFQSRLVYFNPPVDLLLFSPSISAKNTARVALGLKQSDLVVGNVANLNKMKGHMLFIQAAALLKKKLPNCKFVILGAKYSIHRKYIDSLYRFAEKSGLMLDEDIFFVDPSSDVYKLEPAFDIFWMTSRPNSEGIPTSVEEAMALGIPVVSTDVGSTSEIVKNDYTGYIVDCFDAEALVSKTELLFSNKTLYSEISMNCKEFAQKNFSIRSCADKHKYAYQLALNFNK